MYRLLTHNDLDGLGCGVLARLAFGKNIEIQYNSVSGINPQVEAFLKKEKKEEMLWITDLSVNEQNAELIDAYVLQGGKAKLIDHHKSALHLNAYAWASVQVEEDGKLASATSLFYRYLKAKGKLRPDDAVDQFVELVRQMDTWEWEKNQNVQAKKLNDLFYMYTVEEFEEILLHKLTHSGSFSFDDLEEKILDLEEKKIARYINGKKREVYQAVIDGYYAGVVHAESHHSELGNELAKEYPHLDYIAIIMVGKKRISFRTIHDHVDVSEIAKKYDGGGHRKASGAMLTAEAFRHFVEETFKSEPLKRDFAHNQANIKGQEAGCLYQNRCGEPFFVYKDVQKGWVIEAKGLKQSPSFSDFEDAEKFVKRQFQAWLVQDDVYIEYMEKKRRIDSGA
ncbi:oligoribonuclease NrnB [Weizmannia acidilactici]|uniref:Oligoribonuclease NrnB n=1 Tax=Weizmannia acidilactici TaxID=2607726 RepID=A0A5J4JED6_9BACI|nr:DHHA1 domain-containing protein [Weizmannia acidilactici]GER67688.1 oligoribonuclease NrnB [Weizmannia acidilactici]GER68927.1 oligoribonuclease NrnB [Weizmannia acidilactici]GER73891.1 oligoribonuclease NrnB [Weizmannia acidilactici]